ncbi:D-alanyl-D-alanine carboxypeptidase family protein [Shouchella shacheensis]|uniref:D-alanyl-D-alanine carboxypeptidase family protein n=1 Tax=Shouchella shacheensis TaxID=1649580 RepID=UPI00073FD17C|nr:D-alanyl-D-alanine carboxypeptidase family protein [Shouchella shacheensis]
MVKKQLATCIMVGLLALATSESKAETKEPLLEAEASLLMDAQSGQILFEENGDEAMYPASVTKIVTGIMAIEEGNLEELVTVSEEATHADGTRVYLLEDEKVELETLVQGLLINSGNDAGTAIAEHLAGSEAAFAKEMNAFVEEKIGVEDTHFTNPHGLFDEDHYTTVEDMALITNYALENETFREIVGTKELDWEGEGWETTLYNHHRLLWDYEGAVGVKNGFVTQSGFTLVTAAERNGQELIAVTFKNTTAQNSYDDTTELLDYGFETFSSEEIPFEQTYYNQENEPYTLIQPDYVTFEKEHEVEGDVVGNYLILHDDQGNFLKEVEVERENSQDQLPVSQPGAEESWLEKVVAFLKTGLAKTIGRTPLM